MGLTPQQINAASELIKRSETYKKLSSRINRWREKRRVERLIWEEKNEAKQHGMTIEEYRLFKEKLRKEQERKARIRSLKVTFMVLIIIAIIIGLIILLLNKISNY